MILQSDPKVHGYEHRGRATCGGIKEHGAIADTRDFTLQGEIGPIRFLHNPIFRTTNEFAHHCFCEDLLDAISRSSVRECRYGNRVSSSGKRVRPADHAIAATARGQNNCE